MLPFADSIECNARVTIGSEAKETASQYDVESFEPIWGKLSKVVLALPVFLFKVHGTS